VTTKGNGWHRARSPSNDDGVIRYCEAVFSKEGLSKLEIARILGVSPATVTRRDKEARARRLIRTVYAPPPCVSLERELFRTLGPWGIQGVLVCEGGRAAVGSRAAKAFEDTSRNGQTVVLDGGRTVAGFVESLTDGLRERMRIIPLVADPASYDSSSYELMTRMAIKYRAAVWCGKLPYWKSPALRPIHDQIHRAALQANFIVLGAGPWRRSFTALQFVEHLGLETDRLLLRYRGKVCAVVGYCGLREDGSHRRIPEVYRRLQRSLDYSELKRLAASSRCTSMLLAATRDKLDPVLASIRARICNLLVVDEELAFDLARCCRKSKLVLPAN
jgi:DNA-binding transcriptional regulator LsrR (DeoR family)